MSTENKELATRMIEEAFNRGNVDKVDEFLASDFVEREELPPGVPSGREGVKQLALMMRSAVLLPRTDCDSGWKREDSRLLLTIESVLLPASSGRTPGSDG